MYRLLVGLLLLVASAPAFAAPEVVQEMIAAHGGMDAWAAAPTVSFTDSWTSPRQEGARTMSVTVEQGARRAYADLGEGHMSWDGGKAWSTNWEGPPPRFVALLNYYFLNLPWLTMDPGVHLAVEEGTRKLPFDDTEYVPVRMTFDSGVGDTPDDWYLLYIHPETHRLHGCDYIVTYSSLLPEGVEHTPVHALAFEEFAEVSGLVVPTAFTIYEGDDVYAKCAITDWSFSRPFDATRMTMPDGAAVDETTP